MNQRALLRKTMERARTGDADALENFYILTVQDTYKRICLGVGDEKKAQALLVDTYVSMIRYAHALPLGEDALYEQIGDTIARLAYKKLGLELHSLYERDEYADLSEDRAATLWLRIEEKAGFNRETPQEDRGSAASYLYSTGKVLLTVLVVAAAGLILYRGVRWFQENRAEQLVNVTPAQTEETETVPAEIIIEKERGTPGFTQNPDGSLYYVKKDGLTADQSLPLGKQILFFSAQGELTLIGSNPEVVEDPALSFDEAVRYEVRNGDIYRRDPALEEGQACVVMNGHVAQADVRCGYLWYICRYQAPNSDQVRTTVYRSDPDGENQEEVYTTDKTLNTEQFQVTSRWMYYLSDGMLLRRRLADDRVELLAENVQNYFAWEDTAYYMRDRMLERVSEGQDYSGIEAGYQIELQDQGLVLLDMLGEAVRPDENGEKQVGDRIYGMEGGFITSVRPAARENDGVLYYIDDAGSDRKIYSRSSSGVQGLIRQEGMSADSLCIAGEWLYYSARIAKLGDEWSSRIYRVNLQTMELQTVGDSFRGIIKNLYYFENQQKIFGEYLASIADPEDIHGRVIVIPIGEAPGVLDDAAFRPAAKGSDMLEVVMAEGNRVYCLYHTGVYDSGTESFQWTSTAPLEIQFGTEEKTEPEGEITE